jgi:hypothetical protein
VNNIETLKLILKMYSFEQPIPDSVKLQMMVSMRKNLVIILKRFGKYGIMTMTAVYLFFVLKKIGLSVSLLKAYIMLLVMSALVAAAVGFVAYSIVNKYFTDEVAQKATSVACDADTGKKIPPLQKSIQLTQNYKVEMFPFVASGEIASESKKVTNAIFSYMKKQLNETVVLSEMSNRAESPYMMVGSIIHICDTNTINARLVDARNSMVLLYISEEWANDDDIGPIAEKIAFACSRKIKELYAHE